MMDDADYKSLEGMPMDEREVADFGSEIGLDHHSIKLRGNNTNNEEEEEENEARDKKDDDAGKDDEEAS